MTLWFTLTIRGLLRHWRMPWTAVGVIAALVVLLIDWPIAGLVNFVRDDEISQELYAGWYVPVIYAGVAAHATSLIAGALFSRWHFARVARGPEGSR